MILLWDLRECMGDKISGVRESARGEPDVAGRRENETMLLELLGISAELNSPDVSVDRILEAITETSNRIVRSRFSVIFDLEEKTGKLVMTKSYKAPASYPKMISEGFSISVGEGPAGIAFQRKEPLLMEDLLNNPAFSKWQHIARQEGYNAIYAFPIKVAGNTQLVLNLYFDDPHPRITAGQLALLETFSHQAGVAFYRASLDEERRRMLEENKRRIEELEKFHRLVVGRELKMIELKDKIKELEERLAELEGGKTRRA